MSFLPGLGQMRATDADGKESWVQTNPIESKYSPRLFGSPPQLTSLCDMRIDSQYQTSSYNTSTNTEQVITVEGATGDWYRSQILKKAQVANFFVGRALFTGGYNSIISIIRQFITYQEALSRYDIYDSNDQPVSGISSQDTIDLSRMEEVLKKAYDTQKVPVETSYDSETVTTPQDAIQDLADAAGQLGNTDALLQGTSNQNISLINSTELSSRYGAYDDGSSDIMDISQLAWNTIDAKVDNFEASINAKIAGLGTPLIHSLSINQPFYTFEADWFTYINNVKMMINAAVVMLGLQNAVVRIGDYMYPIGLNVKYNDNNDVWTNYRYITPDEGGIDMTTSIDNMKGESNQYVSFMIDTVQESESFTNSTSESQIYSSILNQGSGVGNEIAFITNSSSSVVDDAVVSLAGSAINAAEGVMQALTFGVGRFTAAVASGMARSFLGDKTIYPKIFQSHSSTSNMTVNIKLRASRGDPYSYLTEVLVPLFHILGMALPKMSEHSAGAYQYPPIIQCQIPGVWGTRLGMITSVSIQKNPEANGLSVNGYPLSINVSISIEDLCHCMVTTPMNKPAYFLNNQTMFDYIAQCTGVDKYRTNSSIRLVTRLALAASYVNNMFYNFGEAIANDITTWTNKHTRIAQQ